MRLVWRGGKVPFWKLAKVEKVSKSGMFEKWRNVQKNIQLLYHKIFGIFFLSRNLKKKVAAASLRVGGRLEAG